MSILFSMEIFTNVGLCHPPNLCSVRFGTFIDSSKANYVLEKIYDTLLLFSSIHQYLRILILTFISNKDQSFRSNRSLISGVLLSIE